jgi:uncharacterized membrane protein HdeD (DUF308 family)
MNTSTIPQRPTGWSIFLGVLLILAGLLAIAAPFVAGVAAASSSDGSF